MRYPLPWFPLSDGPSRCSCRTTTNCRPYQSYRAGCRFGRSGSSGFVGGFRLLRWSGCGSVPRVRNCRDRCRYRYTCCPVGFLAVNGCRPKRIQVPLRGCLRSRSRVRVYHADFTSGLEVSYGLRIANFGSIPDILLYQK